jgi:hypothetical protein
LDEPLFWGGLVYEFQEFGKRGYVYYNTFINDVEPQSNQLVFRILTKEIILTETHDKSNARSRRMWKFIPMLDTVFEKLMGRLILTVRENASEDGSNFNQTVCLYSFTQNNEIIPIEVQGPFEIHGEEGTTRYYTFNYAGVKYRLLEKDNESWVAIPW